MSLQLRDTDTTLTISDEFIGEVTLSLFNDSGSQSIKLDIDQAIEVVHHLAKQFDLNIRQ